MGGMQVLQFVSNFPNKSFTAIPIACTASHSAQNIALNELGRQSIMADRNWQNGFYEEQNKQPDKGLAPALLYIFIVSWCLFTASFLNLSFILLMSGLKILIFA